MTKKLFFALAAALVPLALFAQNSPENPQSLSEMLQNLKAEKSLFPGEVKPSTVKGLLDERFLPGVAAADDEQGLLLFDNNVYMWIGRGAR